MKHLLLILLLLPLGLLAQNLDKLDEKYGFRDAVLETDFSQFQNMTLLEDGGNTKIYKRTTDALKIGEAELSEITYVFYGGKLYSINLTTKPGLSSSRLLDILIAQYGKGYQANRYIPHYDWEAVRTLLLYKRNTATDIAKVTIKSIPMSEIEERESKEAAKSAVGDL